MPHSIKGASCCGALITLQFIFREKLKSAEPETKNCVLQTSLFFLS